MNLREVIERQNAALNRLPNSLPLVKELGDTLREELLDIIIEEMEDEYFFEGTTIFGDKSKKRQAVAQARMKLLNEKIDKLKQAREDITSLQ